jgi:hypothetical protein
MTASSGFCVFNIAAVFYLSGSLNELEAMNIEQGTIYYLTRQSPPVQHRTGGTAIQ